jgi:hypothetical protein
MPRAYALERLPALRPARATTAWWREVGKTKPMGEREVVENIDYDRKGDARRGIACAKLS